MTSRRGLTLLETMVALVILAVVAVAYLELFGGTNRTTQRARQWSLAVAYAEDGMEQVKLTRESEWSRIPQVLDGGFTRRVDAQPWRDNLELVSVTVSMPDGAEFSLSRLATVR